ncbi:hypothetical protein NZA98_02240, partial [Escherichia coli]|nr:hypothetical protein [Escherichia coli]
STTAPMTWLMRPAVPVAFTVVFGVADALAVFAAGAAFASAFGAAVFAAAALGAAALAAAGVFGVAAFAIDPYLRD